MTKRKANRNQRPASAPLLSWDIFMDGYHRLMRIGEDRQQLKALMAKNGWQLELEQVYHHLQVERKVIVVTDLSLKIVFASSNLMEMTGYLPKEVIGRSPKIFQGKDTSEETRAKIRTAITDIQPFHVTLVNYRRNGLPYNCEVQAFPVFNQEGTPVHFIAFENEAA